jgi:hypothetical protein
MNLTNDHVSKQSQNHSASRRDFESANHSEAKPEKSVTMHPASWPLTTISLNIRILVNETETSDYTNGHSKQCAVFCTTQGIQKADDSISKASEHGQNWDYAIQQRSKQSFEQPPPSTRGRIL